MDGLVNEIQDGGGAAAAGAADELDGVVDDLGGDAQLDLGRLGLEVRRTADDFLEVLSGGIAAVAQHGQGFLCGAGVVGERLGLQVGDELGGFVDDGDGPHEQPYRSEGRLVALADDVDAALDAGQRGDEDVGAVYGGEVLEPAGGPFQPGSGVGDDVPAGPWGFVTVRVDGQADAAGRHAGGGKALGY